MNQDLIKEYSKKWKKEFKKVRTLIDKYHKIIVFRHIKPDFDALGTQMGLVTFLKDNFPDKEIHYVGDNHVSFMPRLYPYAEKLNDADFNEPFLAIIVDVGDHGRIADPRYTKASDIVKFDHHPFKEEVANVGMVDEELAACSEFVSIFCLTYPRTQMTQEAAGYFYSAIVGDSGRFMYSSTSPLTFTVALKLLETGININSIYQKMYVKKIDDLKVMSYILNNFHVTKKGVSYYLLPIDVQKSLNITSERGKDNVNLFSNIDGIEIWCSITEDPDPKDYCWRISIRSKALDISKVAAKWGGGGHPQASGAKIKDLTELDSFLKDLDDLIIK